MEAGKGTSRTTVVQSLLAGARKGWEGPGVAGRGREWPGGAATTGLRAAQGAAGAERQGQEPGPGAAAPRGRQPGSSWLAWRCSSWWDGDGFSWGSAPSLLSRLRLALSSLCFPPQRTSGAYGHGWIFWKPRAVMPAMIPISSATPSIRSSSGGDREASNSPSLAGWPLRVSKPQETVLPHDCQQNAVSCLPGPALSSEIISLGRVGLGAGCSNGSVLSVRFRDLK